MKKFQWVIDLAVLVQALVAIVFLKQVFMFFDAGKPWGVLYYALGLIATIEAWCFYSSSGIRQWVANKGWKNDGN